MNVVGTLVIEMLTDVSKYEKGLSSAEATTKGWAGRISGVAGNALALGVAGAAAGAAVAVGAIGKAAFDVSSDTAAAAKDISASLGIPIEKAEEFADVAKRVYGNNFAGSVEEAGKAVGLLAQQVDGIGDNSAGLQSATEKAFALRDVFGIDVAQSIDAVDTLMENFGISSDKAFDLVTSGFQKGLNRSGDFLETVGEYSNQFADGGASAEQFFGLLDSGLQGGLLGSDKAADAFKEFRVRIQDGSTATADALAAIGIDADELAGKFADGSITSAQAFDQVITALNNTDDANVRMQAGVGLLGTQFEDLGEKGALGLSLVGDSFASVEGSADSLNVKYETLGDFAAGMWRRTAVAVSPLTDELLELANSSIPTVESAFAVFEENVVPTIEAIGSALSTVTEFVSNLFSGDELSSGIDRNIKTLNIFKGWFDENLPLIQDTVETILGSIQTFWENHGDKIMTVVQFFLDTVETLFDTVLYNILDLITVVMQLITGDFEGAGETFVGIWQRTWDAISGIFTDYIKIVKMTVSGGMEILVDIVTGIGSRIYDAGASVVGNLQDGIASKWDDLTDWFSGKLSGLTDLLPFSPPKDSSSPLTRLPKAGQGIVEQIQTGIDSASLNIDAIGPDTPDVAGISFLDSASGGGQSFTFNIEQVFNGETDREGARGGTKIGVIEAVHSLGLSAA